MVVIESNPTIPSEVDYVQANDGGLNRGCSLRTLVRLRKTKRCELAAVTAWNAVFVRVADFVRLDLDSRWQRLLHKAWLRLTGRRSPSRG